MVRGLAVSVVWEVARSLGADVALPELTDPRLGDPAVAAEVVAAANYHAVLPLLWAAARRVDATPALQEAAHRDYLPLVARGLRLGRLMEVVVRDLTAAGIDFAVYKGPALAHCYYPRPALRAFGDLDVLVDRADLAGVDAVLRGAGLSGSGWPRSAPGYGETEYVSPGLGVVDLHWHVMREPLVRRGFAVDTAAMLARAESMDVGGLAVPVLDPPDLLLAVATHACFDGAYRLGWLVDVARMLRSDRLDWDEVGRRCLETGTSLPVQLVLERTRQELGVLPLGPRLARCAWTRFVGAVSEARPAHRSFRQAGRAGVVFRATRSSTVPSVVALGGLLVHEVAVPLLTDPQHRWRRPRGQRD